MSGDMGFMVLQKRRLFHTKHAIKENVHVHKVRNECTVLK